MAVPRIGMAALPALNLTGGDCVDDLVKLNDDPGIALYMGQIAQPEAIEDSGPLPELPRLRYPILQMMSYRLFDRTKLNIKPLAERNHKLVMERIAVRPGDEPPSIPDFQKSQVRRAAERIIAARGSGRPVVLTYGAHLIKNGLAPVVIRLIEDGWVTHLATNGAGSIHDWEFAFLGKSTEDVRANTARGEFGAWEETGRFLNLAVAVGGIDGLGYGWSVGKMIAEDGIIIPSRDDLRAKINEAALFTRSTNAPHPVIPNVCEESAFGASEKADFSQARNDVDNAGEAANGRSSETLGALADMLYLVAKFDLPEGRVEIDHPFKDCSVQHAAYSRGVPFTVHPGIGYDIIYTHPMNCGGAIGRGATWDFLCYAESVSRLAGGVHLSVGSSVMAPMIFEKSLSMANNIALQRDGKPITDHYMVVVDIQDGGDWDWTTGEPPMDHPAYYLRFCKSFYRMGGTLDYVCLDNRQFLLGLLSELSTKN